MKIGIRDIGQEKIFGMVKEFGVITFGALVAAAAVFFFLGYYPILRPWLNKLRPSWLFKGIYFNAVIAVMYTLLLKVLGMAEIMEDYAEMGMVMTIAMMIMGNATFFLLDRLLAVGIGRRRGSGR